MLRDYIGQTDVQGVGIDEGTTAQEIRMTLRSLESDLDYLTFLVGISKRHIDVLGKAPAGNVMARRELLRQVDAANELLNS